MFLLLAFALAWFFESQATTTILFARYAEVDHIGNPQDSNPGLSPAGHARAAELARFVGQIDVVAGVDAIFATQYRSTQETAEPLAQQLRLKVHVVDVSEVKGLLERILREFKGKVVLVITHPEPMPVLIRELHGSKKVPPIAADEHDNVYVVSIPWYGKVKTLRLKYGAPYLPPEASPEAPTPAPVTP
jgi:broad specificity phosphatase PhoE